MPVIITSCSATKRVEPDAALRMGQLTTGDLNAMALEWKARLDNAPRLSLARSLYAGRNFSLCRSAADHTEARLFIVSAGLGLVRGDETVPSYSATVSPHSPDSIAARLTDGSNAREWWAALAGPGAFSRGLKAESSRPILIALPGSYLEMVACDLLDLSDAILRQVRIFSRSVARLDRRLLSLVMPYDNRLDGPDSPLPGTMADFAGRALSDFVDHVLPLHNANAEADAAAVIQRISGWRTASRAHRRRADDDELLSLIRQHLHSPAGKASALLKVIRGDLGIACEDRRLRRLIGIAESEFAP